MAKSKTGMAKPPKSLGKKTGHIKPPVKMAPSLPVIKDPGAKRSKGSGRKC